MTDSQLAAAALASMRARPIPGADAAFAARLEAAIRREWPS
jgi:hypothetical protein